jgi:hypothetical protein
VLHRRVEIEKQDYRKLSLPLSLVNVHFLVELKVKTLQESLRSGPGQLKQIAWENAPHDDNDDHHHSERWMGGSSSSGSRRKAAFTTWM